MSFPNKDNAINSNFILVFPTPLHLHSSPMDSVPAIDYVLTLHERLDFLRKASATTLSVLVNSILELWTCLPQKYLRELGESDQTICLRGSLMCWAVTQGTIVPQEMQLRSILADHNIRIDRIIFIRKRHRMPPERHARFSIIRDSLLI